MTNIFLENICEMSRVSLSIMYSTIMSRSQLISNLSNKKFRCSSWWKTDRAHKTAECHVVKHIPQYNLIRKTNSHCWEGFSRLFIELTLRKTVGNAVRTDSISSKPKVLVISVIPTNHNGWSAFTNWHRSTNSAKTFSGVKNTFLKRKKESRMAIRIVNIYQ